MDSAPGQSRRAARAACSAVTHVAEELTWQALRDEGATLMRCLEARRSPSPSTVCHRRNSDRFPARGASRDEIDAAFAGAPHIDSKGFRRERSDRPIEFIPSKSDPLLTAVGHALVRWVVRIRARGTVVPGLPVVGTRASSDLARLRWRRVRVAASTVAQVQTGAVDPSVDAARWRDVGSRSRVATHSRARRRIEPPVARTSSTRGRSRRPAIRGRRRAG